MQQQCATMQQQCTTMHAAACALSSALTSAFYLTSAESLSHQTEQHSEHTCPGAAADAAGDPCTGLHDSSSRSLRAMHVHLCTDMHCVALHTCNVTIHAMHRQQQHWEVKEAHSPSASRVLLPLRPLALSSSPTAASAAAASPAWLLPAAAAAAAALPRAAALAILAIGAHDFLQRSTSTPASTSHVS